MALKRTSSGSYEDSAFGARESVAIWKACQCHNGNAEPCSRMSRLRTVAPCPDIAGLRIFALRGIVVEADRESLLSGLDAIVQQGRRNINGSKDDIATRICQFQEFRREGGLFLRRRPKVYRTPRTIRSIRLSNILQFRRRNESQKNIRAELGFETRTSYNQVVYPKQEFCH